MNRIENFVSEGGKLAWLLALLISLGAGYLASETARNVREFERLAHLKTEAERRSVELMSKTLNGNVMGALGLLGTLDPDLKREARGENGGKILSANLEKLESIGHSFDAEGTFLIPANGIISASWDSAGKPSTGINVKFRPYYQMAMQGMENVYAAVSTARNDRMLYYAAPVFAETTNATEVIGVVVARTGLLTVDYLLREAGDIALLMSPQDMVFASSRAEWHAHLAGKPAPERIKAIREIRQFGNMFESKDPPLLPVSIESDRQVFEGKRYAVATASVNWNDPLGDWKLVLMEDLGRTVSMAERIWFGVGVTLLVLFISILVLKVMQSNVRQALANRQLKEHSLEQAVNAERKGRIAGAAVRMQRAKSMMELSQAFLYECHVMLGALQGTLYVAEEQNRLLRRVGSYACAKSPQETILYGEGLLGQCAVERRLLIEFSGKGNIFKLLSGLGETQPVALLIAPVLLNEVLLGVTEIALLHQPQEADLELFKELAGLLAMNIEIVSRHTQTAELLSATRAEDETLTAQLHFQQALVDTIPYPVFYKGPDTRFLGFNRAYEETFKVRREDLIGKRVLDLDYLPEADRLAYQAEDEATIASVGTVRRALKIPFADGKLHNTMYFVSGFRQPDGSPGGLVGTFIDMGTNDAEQPS